MRTMKKMIGSSALVMLMAAAPAMADSRNDLLRGDFAVSSSGGCTWVNLYEFTDSSGARVWSGFNRDLTPRFDTHNGPYPYVTSNSMHSVWTFNGDGTGRTRGRSVSTSQYGSGGASDSEAPFTHGLLLDGKYYVHLGTSNSVVVAGRGYRSRISGIPPFAGHLSADRKSLTLAAYDPGVETFEWLNADGTTNVANRICHRSETGVRISDNPGSRGRGED